jgi:hypothetical protein
MLLWLTSPFSACVLYSSLCRSFIWSAHLMFTQPPADHISSCFYTLLWGFLLCFYHFLFVTQPLKVLWTHLEVLYSMMWLVKPTKKKTISTTQINHLGDVPKGSISRWEIKNNMHIHCPAVADSGLGCSRISIHCPDPSFFGAASRLNPQWPGR